jgi:hypothetical protein
MEKPEFTSKEPQELHTWNDLMRIESALLHGITVTCEDCYVMY